MPAISWNCIQPFENWVTFGNLGQPWNWQNDHFSLDTHRQTLGLVDLRVRS